MTRYALGRLESARGRTAGGGLVLLGLGIAGTDLALEASRIAACHSVSTSRCLGGAKAHLLLVAGVVTLLYGWMLLSREGTGSVWGLKRLSLVAVPALADIAWWLSDERLNPGDGAWDGRLVPIRLVFLVAVPALLTAAACVLRPTSWWRTLVLTIGSVAVSYAAPFVLLVAALGGGS